VLGCYGRQSTLHWRRCGWHM